MPLTIAFDRIDAKQQFAGNRFVSESLQPEFVYGFLLHRRHQAAPFVLISLRHTFSRNKKRASALYLQGLRAQIQEEIPSPRPIDSAKIRAKGGGGLGPCGCRDLTRPSPSGCWHIRVMVSTDIQGADLRVASSDRDIFCKVAASSSHPRTAPVLPGAAGYDRPPLPASVFLTVHTGRKEGDLPRTASLPFASDGCSRVQMRWPDHQHELGREARNMDRQSNVDSRDACTDAWASSACTSATFAQRKTLKASASRALCFFMILP